ncbi:MAG: hypothetical protein U0836_27535 [Pirellulales bacterium]
MTTLSLKLRDLLVDLLGGSRTNLMANIDLDDLFDLRIDRPAEIELDELLAEQRLIATVWSVPDVVELRPDLSATQAWEVLQRCRAEYDPVVGLCRQIVARTADALFGTGNLHRAERCQQVLANYNDEWDVEANLVDLLADARHWCDREERDFGKLDRLAHEHYLAELEGGQA